MQWLDYLAERFFAPWGCVLNGHVAREDEAALHFEVGRPVMERLGYPEALLDAAPPEALASFAGVGYHLDLAKLRPIAASRHGDPG